MYAIISDIHGNLEALNAVLESIASENIEHIICLGDVVCYGPDSVACVRKSAEWQVVTIGDWDQAILQSDESKWTPTLLEHIKWVRRQFEKEADSDLLFNLIRRYVTVHSEFGCQFTHGIPSDFREWVFPEDVHVPGKLNRIAKEFAKVCFVGHSHLPGIFQKTRNQSWTFVRPENDQPYQLNTAGKMIIAAGSVGQPRDNDPRASYIVANQSAITFRRVEYDLETTSKKIRSIPEIDDMQGERLRYGI